MSTTAALEGAPTVDRDIARVRRYAKLLDTALLDPILGAFVPGLGDFLGAALGMYIIIVAAQRKLPAVVIARMLLNLATDSALGVVPVVGGVADLVYKANNKNVDLLEARHASGGSSWKDWAMVGGAFGLLVAAVAASAYATIWLLHQIF